MDSLNWYQGKRLKSYIEHGTQGSVNLTHWAVVAILTARDQGKTIEDIVRELILANEFKTIPATLDKDAAIRDLGY
jgi:hypothetical protein